MDGNAGEEISVRTSTSRTAWPYGVRTVTVGLLALGLSACATGRAVRSGDAAAKRGDWDTAVAYYREAIGHDPGRIDVKTSLQQAMGAASAAHLKRARDLEAQDQLPGAAAEYRLAADMDPANILAMSKASEIDRKIRDAVEASRPKPQIETLRQQAAQSSPIPHLDPRLRVPHFAYNGSVKELLTVIGNQTGIAVRFDQQVQPKQYSISVDDSSLEDVLNQVVTENQLTYKVVNTKTIFVYNDDQQSRQKYDDQYAQLFYVSNVDPTELNTVISAITTATGATASRPTVTPIKSANAILVKATEPVMRVIEQIIRAADKPKAEVLVDVEILEVDRTRVQQLGIDLSQWALGFQFSPETTAPTTSTAAGFPTPANPFNLNTVSQGIATNNFYVTAPSALIRALEQDNKTRILAKPQLRGREGVALTLNLGQSIPIPSTQFQASATGGVNNVPVTQITYQSVGVNLSMTPQVTFDDEVILNSLTVDNSSIGPDINVAGTPTTSLIDRKATVTMRLRDGESNLLAGLISDNDKRNYSALPGLANIPILRNIFGNGNIQHDQTDIVMIVTPHILDGHHLTASDLKPMYIGTGQNLGGSTPPTLISPDIPIQQPAIVAPGAPIAGATGTVPTTSGLSNTSGTSNTSGASSTSGNNPRVVPIEAVPSTPVPAAAVGGQILITAPSTPMQVGGPVYTVPVTITGAQQVGTATITITYDPKILRATTVTQGTFMQQGGVPTTFAPKIDATAGRVDIPVARPSGTAGASGTGLLAAIAFQAVAPGSTTIGGSAVVLGSDGKAVPVQLVPTNVTIK
jgi:general secretion pathway protein D